MNHGFVSYFPLVLVVGLYVYCALSARFVGGERGVRHALLGLLPDWIVLLWALLTALHTLDGGMAGHIGGMDADRIRHALLGGYFVAASAFALVVAATSLARALGQHPRDSAFSRVALVAAAVAVMIDLPFLLVVGLLR